MLKYIEINGYRGFDKITLDNFSKINIILGENNLGKTSILESIFGFACGQNVFPLIDHAIMRRNVTTGTYDFMERILGAFNDTKNQKFSFSFKANINNEDITVHHYFTPGPLIGDLIPNAAILSERAFDTINNQPNNIIGKWEVYYNNIKKKESILIYPNMDIQLSGEPLMLANFNDIISHRNQQVNTRIYSQLKRERVINEFIEEMNNIFGSIKDIDSIPYPDGSAAPVSIMNESGKYIPLYNFGDGLQRWFNILGGMVSQKNSIHCIEEVDVTFHPKAQNQLAKNLLHYSDKFNNQLFMTSHSIEFIDNFLQGLSEDELEEVRIITLKKSKDNKIKHRTLSGKEALISRELYEMELR